MNIKARSQALVKWAMPQGVDIDGFCRVYKDARDGNVDYDNPISPDIPAWPDGIGKLGLGAGPMGSGQLGRGTTEGYGMGIGPMGLGPMGVGGLWRLFRTDLLRDGNWKFGVKTFDKAGNSAAATTTVAQTLAGTPAPPTKLIAGLDGGDVKISWTLSIDDGQS